MDKKQDDLISRRTAISEIFEDSVWLERQGCTEITIEERKQRDRYILECVPSITPKQPEIVRCKDCNHFYKDNLNQWCFCGKYGVKEDDFCSRAERRTDEQSD